jgi:serine/threonine protein kinase
LDETDDSQILYNFTIRLRKSKNTISLVTLLWNTWKAGHSTTVSRHPVKCQKLLFNTSFVKFYVHWNICTNDIKSRIEILNLLYLFPSNVTNTQNILLCDRGLFPTVKIADLGLAKIEAATKNNTFCGSPGYLAPECTQGPQAVGLNWAMDIYAVGVITYELYPTIRDSV